MHVATSSPSVGRKEFEMQNATSGQASFETASIQSNAATSSIALAFVLGLVMVFITGFSHMEIVHNAGHDTRHSLAFPCH